MACPLCGAWGPGDLSVGIGEDDDLCLACRREGNAELGCGCLERADGTRLACSPKHELCDACGMAEKQATADLCGDCLALEEDLDRYAAQTRSQWEARR
jgi:hypothetical protein